jgi:hypothetical protein
LKNSGGAISNFAPLALRAAWCVEGPCDRDFYGRSYLRPLVALLAVVIVGTLAFLPLESLSPLQSLGLSAANTLNVFGFRRDFNLSIDTPLAWLKIVAALQTVLGTILLFLVGLDIRNKFRMK